MTEETTVTDLADLKDIAGNAPQGDAAEIARVSAPLRQQELDKQGRAYATGRRKDAVARVWVKPGTGKITINGRDQEVYFARPTLRLIINQPFGITDRTGQYDVVATVRGGGLSGERHAVDVGDHETAVGVRPLHHRCRAADHRRRERMAGAVVLRNQRRENLVRHAHQHQRQQRDPGVGEPVAGEGRGLVQQLGAIPFALGERGSLLRWVG